MEDLVGESIKFMILGMIIVYLLLSLIVILTYIQAKIVTKYFPDKIDNSSNKKDNVEDKALMAAITAAVMQYRKNS